MVFANLFFIYAFLPVSLFFYYITKNLQCRNIVLILSSLFFYAWGEPVWILLLVFSAFMNYIFGLTIENNRDTAVSKAALVFSVVLNLGLLVLFKYSAFLIETLSVITGSSLKAPHFGLPIGISFYTFQALSYVVDVYKSRVSAQRSFPNFFLYLSLFHQLVAGPIVRYAHIADSIDKRDTDVSDISKGVTRFLVGMFKKVIVANTAGQIASVYLDGDLRGLSVAAAWYVIFLFALQIYYDFSGYSDMAIGLGKMFGFHYRENFIYPYLSTSVADFWRKWHVSLSSFFRDYVYIPLGGKEKRHYLNLLIVWTLTGLWHGASWNFVLWGMYFFVIISIEKLFLLKFLKLLPNSVRATYSFIMVLLGWVLFYFVDFSRLVQFASRLFGLSGTPITDVMVEISFVNNIFWLILAVMGAMPIAPIAARLTEKMAERSTAFRVSRSVLVILINVSVLFVSTVFLTKQSFNPFLYFRF